MKFLELITGIEAGDQATSNEMVQARMLLADDIDTAIPDCIMGAVDGWRWDAINVLLYVRLKRDNPKITPEQAAATANRNNQREVIEELLYFYGDTGKKEIKDYLDIVFNKSRGENCSKCNHATLESWTFCPGCGKRIPPAKEPVKEAKTKGNPTQSKTSSKA